jgi:FKBP-type peptidyl-prolyl cis-trans isomerase FklB
MREGIAMAMRWKMALGMALLAGIAGAQEAPVKSQAAAQEAPKDQAQEAPAIKSQAQGPTINGQAQGGTAINSRKDKLSYAYGVELARGLKWQRMDLDLDLMVKGLRDAFSGDKLLITADDVVETLKTFQEERKQDLEHARKMISEKNKKAGEEFVAENVKKDGVVTLPSGLQYKILKQGDGKRPALDDKVACHYRGTLLDGREFDSSYQRNQPATVPVKGVIKGWSEALQLMPVGSKWQLFIPPQLAYGDRGVGGIGPNATLIFEVELISIQDKPQTQATQSSP